MPDNDDPINDWIDNSPTVNNDSPTLVTALSPDTTPTRAASDLPGYELGFVNGYAEGLKAGQAETKVKEWITGVNQAFIFVQDWMVEKEVPNAKEIIIAIKSKFFSKP